ncbi:MAG: helix-turn-helix domain-containing protein [Firmicutes bacterium]|nr:helix-turn-helix domain-containing protein [Bacillota bacterium]
MTNMFASRLAELRKEQGLSQRALSESLNISQPAICLYEKGEREPDFNTVLVLAVFFGVTTDYLLGLENEDGSKNLPQIKV